MRVKIVSECVQLSDASHARQLFAGLLTQDIAIVRVVLNSAVAY